MKGHVSAGSFNIGDIVVYHGPTQANLLAPGDHVEVETYDYLRDEYRIKLSTPYAAQSFTCKGHHLQQMKLPNGYTLSSTLDSINSAGYTEYTTTDATNMKRKEQGECLTCGTKLSMSSFGLLPCTRCPEPQQKW